MKLLTKIIISICLFASISATAANGDFVIKDIHVQGLQRINLGTVLDYLPVQVGDTFRRKNTATIIRTLYDTGFFYDVSLARDGNTLIVQVKERPTISSVKFYGNKKINKEEIQNILKRTKVVEGEVYNDSTLGNVKQELQQQYYSMGYYNVEVDAKANQLERNRVAVTIRIDEGPVAKIREIKIIGNKEISEKHILRQMRSTTPGVLTIFTEKDRYSKLQLEEDLDSIRAYYLDRGYLKFKVESKQVSLSQDKRDVFIVIRIFEGASYKIKDVKFTGKTILNHETLRELVRIKNGSVFSRRSVAKAQERISKRLGDDGYAFAKIDVHPDLDEDAKTVLINFILDPGQRVYIRRINFFGNTKTSDRVLRRAIPQLEGGLFSIRKVQESKRRLDMLGYLKNVTIKPQTIPDASDQVDLDFSMEEAPSAVAQLGVGYGTDGFLFDASFHQSNFMGTGKTIGIDFNRTAYNQNYNLTYYNPFHTKDGIGRGFNVFYQRTTPGKVNVTTYTADKFGGNMNYSIPIAANSHGRFSFGYRNLHLMLPSNESTQATAFSDKHGTTFDQLMLSGGWNYNGQDRALFPSRGINSSMKAEVSAPVGGRSLEYYKVSAQAHWYYPFDHDRRYLFSMLGGLGYGNGYGRNDELPFFENYFAGGMSRFGVRGYETHSLGPQDSKNKPVGGNFAVNASLGFVFPNPISPE